MAQEIDVKQYGLKESTDILFSNSDFVGTSYEVGATFTADALSSVTGTIEIGEGRNAETRRFSGIKVLDPESDSWKILVSRHFKASEVKPHLGKKVKLTILTKGENDRKQNVFTVKIEAA